MTFRFEHKIFTRRHCRTTLQNTAEPDPETELAKCAPRRALGASARTRAMPGRTRGDAAARRVVERLFALTVDDEADAGPASTSGDAGRAQIPDAGERVVSARRGASPSPRPPPPSVERTVAALKAAYADEKYADVRAAVVAALPRVPHPARFVLRCVEALANESHDEKKPTVAGEKKTRGTSPAEPLTHLLLEALGATECVAATRRPVFAAIEAGTRLVDPEARAAAAALLARTFRGAEPPPDADLAAGDETPNETKSLTGGGVSKTRAACLQPRAAAKLAAVAGIDLADLEAHDPHEKTNENAHRGGEVEHALVLFCGACLGAAIGAPAGRKKNQPKSETAPRVSAAVRLVRHFSLAAFATPSALDAIGACGHGALADGVAACLPTRERERYVRRLAERETKTDATFDRTIGPTGVPAAERAERRMRRLGLPPTSPEQDRAREEARLRRLCAQGRWEVAAALAGEDPGLRAAMAGLRDPTRRSSPHSSLHSRNGNENENAARDVLPLDLPSGAVVFADDARSLRRAVNCLARDAVIGLDTEWRPDSAARGGAPRKNKTSLLQLAGRRSAALLDVPSLCLSCAPDVIDEALRAILCAPREWNGALEAGDEGEDAGKRNQPPIVLGFGLAEDLRRAARSWPSSLGRALAAIPRAVCLQALCASSPVCRDAGLARLPGLSAVAAHFLGAPLDKTETCSDWNRRPLSAAQTRYAAQDARVLVRLLPGVLAVATVEHAAAVARDRHAAPAVPSMLAEHLERVADDFFEGEFAALELETRGREGSRNTTSGSKPIYEHLHDGDDVSEPLTPSDTAAALLALLAPLGVDPTPIRLPPETGPTAEDTAAALGPRVPVDAVVKSIGVVIADGSVGVRHCDRGAAPGSRSAAAVAAALGAPLADRPAGGGGDANAEEEKRRTENFPRRTVTPVLLMLRGSDRVDLRLVASHFGVAKRKVRLATPEECVRIFGYPPGSMPPVGLRDCAANAGASSGNAPIPALMDAAVRALGARDVYPGAGAPDLVFRCPADLLAEATRADVLALAEPGKKTNVGPTTSAEVVGASVAKRFVADGALGRLARWLRALGVDAEHVPAGAAGEYGALLRLAREENRVVLTRDRRVTRRREFRDDVGVFVVEPDDPREQLRFVAARFGLTFQRGRLLTRCAKCNGEVERKLTPGEVAAHPRIPAKVKRAAEDFWACGRCAKVYWIGPKSHKAMDFIREDLMDMLVAKNTPDFIKENFSVSSMTSAAETSAGAAELVERVSNQSKKERDEGEALANAAARGDAWPRGER